MSPFATAARKRAAREEAERRADEPLPVEWVDALPSSALRGHIDHGKTTLVRALTGVDTDRLKEEKARRHLDRPQFRVLAASFR